MNRHIGVILLCTLPLFASAALDRDRLPDSFAAVNTERITQADSEPHNWLAHGRTYSEQRFSPLKHINDQNVKDLGLAWYFDTGTKRGLEASPIVVDGIMYTTGS